MADRPHILVNLPPGFFNDPALAPAFARLAALGEVRQTSHDGAAEIGPDLARADYVLMWSWPKLTADLLDRAPRLRMAAHLDVSQAAARVALDRKLPLSVSRSGFSPAVAEMALTLILSTLRRTGDYHAAMRAGSEPWVRKFPDDIDPRERQLTGRRVGVVGFGQIGRRLVELLGPFRCDVRVADPFVPAEAVAAAGATRATVDDLVAASEVVVLCAAANAGTRHLIGRAQIDAMPAGGVLVNVARAALVDTAALVDRLRRDPSFSAAVDVFDAEPLAADHPLRSLPNAYLTPHRAGGLTESVVRIVSMLVDDIEAHLHGRPPRHPVTAAMVASLDA